MDTNKKTCVILARVSSKSQEDEGYSLDSQLKLLQAYCLDNSLRVVRIYKIAETASKEQSRRIFTELLTYIANNGIYNLAVEKTDRLTRNMKDAVAIDDWLQGDPDRMLHAVKESLRLHKEAKSDVKFMWNIHLAVAKKYTDNLREEAMKGWAEKLAQGWMPSRPPVGYTTAIKNGKRIHVPDPITAKIVAKGFELYLSADGTIRSVEDFFSRTGITTYNNQPLNKNGVHRLLKNPYYMGIIQFNNETYAGSHKPIITKQVYKAVQDKLHGKKSLKRRIHDVPLKNVIKCGHCGKVITWEKHKGHYYGTCHHITPDCKRNKYLREETAQEVLIKKMGELISPSRAVVDWLVKRLETDFEDNTEQAEAYK